jgi:hypothetical protein
MISAGVDIDRLGLMVVMGQPQSTSEYIQATSRVGRVYPGLVVVLLNSARSRDRSHYESFVSYHSTLYRQVESTSVTPFSSRARARGLHAVIVALARLLVPAFCANPGAAAIVDHAHELETVKEKIVKRVSEVEPDEVQAAEREIEEVIAAWKMRVEEVPDLVYSKYGSPTHSLLVSASEGTDLETGDAFPTLWSLRDVDQQSNLYLIREHDAAANQG